MSTTLNLAKLDPSRYRPTYDSETYQLICALAQEVELERAKLIAECYGGRNLGRHLEPSVEAEGFLEMPWYEIATRLNVLIAVERLTGRKFWDVAHAISKLDPPNRGEFFWMWAYFHVTFAPGDPGTGDQVEGETVSERKWRRAEEFHRLGGTLRKAGNGWHIAGPRGALTALCGSERANGRPKSYRQDVTRELKEVWEAFTASIQAGSGSAPIT